MKYWAWLDGEVPGCFPPGELVKLPGFTLASLVCPAEGEVLDKNWRRAGEFDELAAAQKAEGARRPPPAPEPPAPAALAADLGGAEILIDQVGARLFGHVSDLMRELETRRDERGLARALQGRLEEERGLRAQAERRAAEAEARLEAALAKARELEAELARLRRGLAEASAAADGEKLRAAALARALGEKEASLARSLGLLAGLERELARPRPASA